MICGAGKREFKDRGPSSLHYEDNTEEAPQQRSKWQHEEVMTLWHLNLC